MGTHPIFESDFDCLTEMWGTLKPNIREVEEAVSSLIGKEDRYKLENAAKFRAVEQKVGSYEEFKGIVDGCHLKPLDKKEEIDSILKPNQHDWTVAKENKEMTTSEPSRKLDYTVETSVKTYSEFKQMWRKAKSDSKKRLEILLSSDEKIIFRDDCEPLDVITKSKRFELARVFMAPSATKIALELLERLEI